MEKKNLTEILGSELQPNTLAMGSVYLKRKLSKPLLLKNTGDIIDSDFHKKFQDKILLIENFDQKDFHFELNLKGLISEDMESKRIFHQKNFLEEFFKAYFDQHSNVSPLEIVAAIFNTFNKFTKEHLDVLSGRYIDYFNRSKLTGSLSIIFAVFHGIKSKEVLSDIFHLSFISYLPIVQKHLAIDLFKDLEIVRGRKSNKEPDLDITRIGSLWELRGSVSQEINSKFESILFNKERIKILPFLDSDGFGVHEKEPSNGDLMNWERCLIYAERLVPFSLTKFGDEGSNFFKKIILDATGEGLNKNLNMDVFIREILEEIHQIRVDLERNEDTNFRRASNL